MVDYDGYHHAASCKSLTVGIINPLSEKSKILIKTLKLEIQIASD